MLTQLYNMLRRRTPFGLRRKLKAQKWFNPATKFIFGTNVYSEDYYKDVERLEAKWVPIIAEWIKINLKPQSVLDVGCGPGHQMAALRLCGMRVVGVDISKAALKLTTLKGLECYEHNLTDPNALLPEENFDLAICCEVAEHLEERYARIFIHKLAKAAPTVFLTAAEPGGAPGLHHFNERENTYWIESMEREGMRYDAEMTAAARESFSKAGVIVYLARPMIFRRASQKL
jgi:SAM-dependent methyltransferase